MEKRLEGRDNMVMGYDTVSRDMATLRWMGVRESMV